VAANSAPAASAVPAVRIERLCKTYRVYARPLDRLREAITRRPRHRAHQALQDVSVDVAAGEGFGIVGENGAGKSTLLKIVAGVTAATSGRAIVSGTAASILELGGGFHPQLTGRQNIVLSAALLGLSEREVRARTPEIIDFAELAGVIDEPVRCYSTGMSMRLAFAIAIQVQPAVLIVDEALSVGDGYFQRKCMQRIQSFLHGGGTLLFSSHAMYFISEFCTRALWLRDGRVAAIGAADAVIREYEAFLLAKAASAAGTTAGMHAGRAAHASASAAAAGAAGAGWTSAAAEAAGAADAEAIPDGDGPARLLAVGHGGTRVRHAESWWLDIEWTSEDAALGFHLAVGIDRIDGVQAFACSTRHDRLAPFSGQHRYRTRLTVPALPLLKGQFTAYVFLLDEEAHHVYDRRVLPGVLDVVAPEFMAGMFSVPHAWEQQPLRQQQPQRQPQLHQHQHQHQQRHQQQNEGQNKSLSPQE
jgi:lipopolysaccharide transport system ATP-binding protein